MANIQQVRLKEDLPLAQVQSIPRDITDDDQWRDLAAEFRIRVDTTYLNHGSFGIPSDAVRYARRQWINRLDEQPMDFYVRQHEGHLLAAKQVLADFVGTQNDNLIFVDNATTGMNIVADSFFLSPGDEVLITDHGYGAVNRVWVRAVRQQGATITSAVLPQRIESVDQVVNALLASANPKTRLLVISHITSPTALVMPIAEICRAFHERNILVCVDGPHAPAQIELAIDQLDCDYYTASCHKWLSATLGSGFLYVHPKHQAAIRPLVKSWGRLLPELPQKWSEEFTWSGSRDPSAYLTIPAAIKFLEQVGLDQFRNRSRWLASYAEHRLRDLFGTTPIANREDGWYASMSHVPLPPGDWSQLQRQLWEEAGIEAVVIPFANRWFVRVSCHLYNTTTHIDTLVETLSRLTRS